MTAYYTVEYQIYTGNKPNDGRTVWQHLKVQGFTSRENAEWALIELAKHPQFRGGGISSVAHDDEDEEQAA